MNDPHHQKDFQDLLAKELIKSGYKNNPASASHSFRTKFSKKFARYSKDFYNYGNGVDSYRAVRQQVNWALDEQKDEVIFKKIPSGYKLRIIYRHGLRYRGISIEV